MRRVHDSFEPYKVELSSSAWLRIGSLEQTLFERARAALELVAVGVALDELMLRNVHDPGTPAQTVVAGFELTYRPHRDSRTIEVLDLRANVTEPTA